MKKFIIYLVLLSSAYLLIINLIDVANASIKGLMYATYGFIPAITVAIVDKDKIRDWFSRYNIFTKNIKWRKTILYTLSITISYVILMILGHVVVNIINGNENNYITVISESNELNISQFPLVLFIGLGLGLTTNLVEAWGSEIAWRGYFSHNIKLGYIGRNLLTGFIWAIWTISLRLVINPFHEVICECSYILALYLIISFLLDAISKCCGSVISSAAVRGVIIGSGLIFMYPNGTYLLSIISILIITTIVVYINRKEVI